MGGRCAVVSCHVERPLDDRVWSAFARVQERRPGGFRIAALMRPPDAAAGEDEERWLVRAREAAARAPFGHHTHFGGPDTARPPEPSSAAARVREEAAWMRTRGLEPGFYCGGGWYADAEVSEAVAALGYVDCSAVSFPLPWLAPGEPRLRLAEPARIVLPSGSALLELPSTHSLGALARAATGRLPRFVHVHFHDWELVHARRRAFLGAALRALAYRGEVLDLAEAARRFAGAPEVPLRDVLEW